jgi:hypothetical protein
MHDDARMIQFDRETIKIGPMPKQTASVEGNEREINKELEQIR